MTTVVIPARVNASRFPGKMLFEFRGKSLIAHTIEAASQTPFQVLVATDSAEIGAIAMRCGVDVIWTPTDARNGTERVAYAAEQLPDDVFINWQGDSPLILPGTARQLARSIQVGSARVASVYVPGNDAVHVELDAMTGSRAVDFRRDRPTGNHHLGMYAYTREALRWYLSAPPSEREEELGLEQLRWLEMGEPIEMIASRIRRQGLEVNVPEDVNVVAGALVAV